MPLGNDAASERGSIDDLHESDDNSATLGLNLYSNVRRLKESGFHNLKLRYFLGCGFIRVILAI
jgi:hypothetical protein